MKNRIIFHVDIDAFYASVEQHDNPSLKGKPVAVGALPGHRGVVSACSYEARRFGIHSAMPVSQAQKKCPHAIFLPPRMKRYIQVSKRIMRFLKDYSPEFRQISIDEAFLDLSGTGRLLGSPLKIGRYIKEKIKKSEGLNLSIGVASNPYMAKLASEAGKPNGLRLVREGEEILFLDTLELKKLWGVGGKTLDRLRELNITTIPRLRSFTQDILKSMLGEGAASFLYKAVRGIDPGIYPSETKSRSVSSEVTFETDRKDPESLKRVMLELSQEIMGRLLTESLRSKTVCLKLRYHDFRTTNAQKTVGHWLTSSDEILRIALELLEKRWDGQTPIRLIGIGVAGVDEGNSPDQLELFSNREDKRKQVEEAVMSLKKRIDGIKLTRASLLKGDFKGGSKSHEDTGQRGSRRPAIKTDSAAGEANGTKK